MQKYVITTLTFWGIHGRYHFHIIKGKNMPILFEAGGGGDGADWDSAFLKPVADFSNAVSRVSIF
jgi:hypothetical protein